MVNNLRTFPPRTELDRMQAVLRQLYLETPLKKGPQSARIARLEEQIDARKWKEAA